MPIKLQIIIGVIILLAMVIIFRQVHRNKLNLRFALSWIMLGVIMLILDIWPGLAGWLSELVGITLPINMLFFLGFLFTLVLIFGLTKRISKLTDETKRLTQEIAILKEKLGIEEVRKDS